MRGPPPRSASPTAARSGQTRRVSRAAAPKCARDLPPLAQTTAEQIQRVQNTLRQGAEVRDRLAALDDKTAPTDATEVTTRSAVGGEVVGGGSVRLGFA